MDDAGAWNFYWQNARGLEIGLMPKSLADAGLDGVAEEIFFDKLSAIQEMRDHYEAKATKEAGPKPDIIAQGSENG